jgi:hypothetical protein
LTWYSAPEPSYLENIGKSARVGFDRDFDAEEREHYIKMQKYQPMPPWPEKALSPLTQEKDIDDRDGGFGNSFWPNKREQEEIEAVIWQEVRACDSTFLPDNEGTPAWIKKKNGWAYLKRVPTHNEQNAINVPFTQERAHSNPQNKYKKNKKDIEETAMTMIDWVDEDEDSMPPPLMAKRTYINDEGEESSLESDENSVLNSRGYDNEPNFDNEDEDNDDNGRAPLIPRFVTD